MSDNNELEIWQRVGNVVYTRMHAGWKKGVELFKNRLYFGVQCDHSIGADEAEAAAAHIQKVLNMHQAPQDGDKLCVSLDGGKSWIRAPEGVGIHYEGSDHDISVPDLMFAFTDAGLSIDAQRIVDLLERDTEVLGTEGATYDEITERITK